MRNSEERMDAQGRDIQQRTFDFALRILRLLPAIPQRHGGGIIGRQLARSGTSVGANVEEAQGSHSKKDFVRRMNIALAEARETYYWLRLLMKSELVEEKRLVEIIGEADQLVRILTTIVMRAKQNNTGET